MHKNEILYLQPKSWLRGKIQKIFLIFLSKIFPKKFLSHKDKIKIILNKIRANLFYGLVVIFLRFKYPFYYMLPAQHIYALHSLIKFLKILKTQKINFFLLGGSLLGSVRQESFADVRDIDLGVKEDQLKELLNSFPLLIKKGVKRIKSVSINEKIILNPNKRNGAIASNTIERFQINLPFILIDISIYRKKDVSEKEIWIGETNKHYTSKFKGIIFSLEDLDNLTLIDAYGKKFLSPSNPEVYLKQKYGDNWKTPIHHHSSPIKNEFFWNKSKMFNKK